MSTALGGPRGKKTNRKSPEGSWRQVLELGERLLALRFNVPTSFSGEFSTSPIYEVIQAQRELVIQTAAILAGGQAELWLPISQESPPTSQMREAFETQRMYLERPFKKATSIYLPLLAPQFEADPAQVLGVLAVHRPSGPPFQSSERELFSGLAFQAALALQAGRQLVLDRRREAQLAVISEVGNAITSILEQDELLQQVVDLIQERFGYPFVHLFSVHPGRRKIFFEAGSGIRSHTLADEAFAYDLDDPEGLIPWTARCAETALVNEVNQDERYRPAPIFPQVTRAELTIPLKFGKDVLGVLDIQSDQAGVFGPEQQFLFEALADSIAIAIRNASLYRSEQWRRQVADSLREVAGLLSADVDLEEVLSATLAELEHNLPCDLAAFWFLEEQPGIYEQESDRLALRLAAVRGPNAPWLAPQLGLNIEEILELSRDQSSNGVCLSPAWITEALQSEQPITRSGVASPDLLGNLLEYPPDYSAVATALRVGDKRLGLLTLTHHTPGRYGAEARAMTAAFASYASVAIQNTRLYESAHEQVWVSTVLLQVAEATQSVSDLNELLATIVNITPMLVGVKACAIYLANEDGIFFPAAAAGLPPENQLEFEHRLFAPGDLPTLDHLWENPHPTIIQRTGDDLRLASMFPPMLEKGGGLELLVLAPLLAHGQVLGALLVQYVSDPFRSSIQALENFFDERLSILQGIAHQAATAIENIRLLKSQKEEAYVSVALLQVAQAIVSSSNLQETLGAIVRITPILTGVKRTAIYLYDSKSDQFRLAESYGLPRDADPYPFAPDEFPLLEATLTRNTLIAYPLNPGLEDDWEDVPDAWTYLPAPEPDEIDEYLLGDVRLFLAFPLAVMGDVLGVMLVEEPLLPNTAGQASDRTNLRLRPKRMEITTGISQQAALAVQNDVLKREMVDRERLEREMQLAREIQRTFLPHQLPELPGWELTVWWRTAREVGGDFYDLIDLPGGCLGLVIADVADKGVPAALFMVLVRALLRASANDSNSPAAVLSEVNDLLVPDAQGGMFVTLLYAVLDPQTGQVTFANAGHNPPLWVCRRDQTIEPLTKTGMALGVIQGTRIEEKSLTLDPGDFLTLYTDGVTDASSPDGSMFGYERLYQSVWEAGFEPIHGVPSAGSVLHAIDSAVETFTHGAAPYDDSTVLILLRQESERAGDVA